jgi:pimeloyl-ACP methyl ester carboxylesterase
MPVPEWVMAKGKPVAMVEQRWAETRDGAKISYEFRAETGDETPVLALHGVLVGTSNWVHQTLRMPNVRWIVPSLRGHGESSPLEDVPDIEDAASDMIAVLDAEGIDKAVIIGNSLGATIGLAIGLLYPERCYGLLLVEPSIPAIASERARDRLVEEARRTRELLETGDVDTALGEFVKPRLGDDWKSKIGRRRLEEWRKNIVHAPAWLDAVVAFHPGPGPLAALDVPTQILHGEHTRSFYLELTKAVQEAVPDAETGVVPDAGHGAPVDNPSVFNEMLNEFITKVATNASE